MSNPYLITGPALISFSGGRTSAYMLRMILDAHGGTLPADVHVVFANTGKEREETLRFVHECGSRWGVKVRWLEWRSRSGARADKFEEVGFNSAARNGEPFAALIASKKFTPNSKMRFCTEELKVKTIRWFCEEQGLARWANVIGLRFDEGHRVLKALNRNRLGKERWQSVMPLAAAKVTKADVMRFWLGDTADPREPTLPLPQGFDLGLRDYEGNCDGCMLKSFGTLAFQERERPGYLDWWMAQEAAGRGRFVTEYSYADIKRHVERSPLLFPLDWQALPSVADCTSEVCDSDNDPAVQRVLQAEFERNAA